MTRPDRVAVMDGTNIAYVEATKDGRPKVSNIMAVRSELQERGFKVLIIVDASLRHEIDDQQQFEALVDKQVVRQAPAGTDADVFILQTAAEHHAKVVSNDRFGAYEERYPWIDDRRVPLMIVEGLVELYEPAADGA